MAPLLFGQRKNDQSGEDAYLDEYVYAVPTMGGMISGKRLAVLFAGILAIALIAAGCGSSDESSGDDGSGDTASVSTKAELIEQGDAICTKGLKQIRTEVTEYMKDKNINIRAGISNTQYAQIEGAVFLPGIQQQVDEVRALGAPSGEEDEVNAILDAFDEALVEAAKDPAVLFEGPNPLAKPNQMAEKYGFKSCGNN